MKRTETIMYQFLLPRIGEKMSNAACLIWQWVAPSSFGGASGGVIGASMEWRHPSIVALLGAVAVTALFNSLKLLLDFTRGKNKESAELVKLMLDRQDAMRLEQQNFYVQREAAQSLLLERERRLKHNFVNRLHLSKLKFAAMRRGMTFEEVDTQFAEQERNLYNEESEILETDSIHATQPQNQ